MGRLKIEITKYLKSYKKKGLLQANNNKLMIDKINNTNLSFFNYKNALIS